MTRLYDDPARFAEDLLEGFLDAHGERVVGVPGGVVRAAETPAGKVAVVVGGGSGHYPAFCGVVGPGFADGAVVGNIFTSPSTQDAYTVGKAAASDGGLLFSTGNYAGDVMNFTLAQQRLIAEGVDTRVVFVTDDVASAPVDEIERRRGIAGDFVVFKIAGAAADERLPPRRGGAGRPARERRAPGPWASRSPAARCPVPIIRCSRCRPGRWASASASTESPECRRRRCRRRPTWPPAWWRECWPRRRAMTRTGSA